MKFCLIQKSSSDNKISEAAEGFIKFKVPIWIAEAPAIINSTTSCQFIIPPIPIIGISTFLFISNTLASATGLIAGPESPPVTEKIFGLRVNILNEFHTCVLIAETASPPSCLTTLANSAMYETFGESFMIIGLFVAARTFAVTFPTAAISFPN